MFNNRYFFFFLEKSAFLIIGVSKVMVIYSVIKLYGNYMRKYFSKKKLKKNKKVKP